MRKLAAAAAALFVLTAGASANAEGVNNLLAGINGLVTFPVDPVMSSVYPPEEFDELWGAPITSHMAGLFQGTLLMLFRATTGAVDIAFFPFWVFPTLSPEARYEIIPGYEIEYE